MLLVTVPVLVIKQRDHLIFIIQSHKKLKEINEKVFTIIFTHNHFRLVFWTDGS
jgi:hypothetical protein